MGHRHFLSALGRIFLEVRISAHFVSRCNYFKTDRNQKYTVCSKKSNAKIKIKITATNLIKIKYPLSSLNYHLSGANVANFNKIHCTVFEQQLFKKWSSNLKLYLVHLYTKLHRICKFGEILIIGLMTSC